MRAIVTVDLGFGDGGKGATVDWLCRRHGAKLVVRYSGGAQCGHNVELPNGHRHCFSQFGAGTFAGADTHLDRQVIIDPLAMRNEAAALEAAGIDRPFRRLTINPQCLVSTPLHKAVNVADAENLKHGTCGMGIGVARKYWLDHGQDAIFAQDLLCPDHLLQKLDLFARRMLGSVEKMHLGVMAKRLIEAARPVQIQSWPNVPTETGTIVFEAAQGLLLDQAIGFHPHTTWSDVTPSAAIELADMWDAEEITVLGITRAYATRHGNGPLPTEVTDLRFEDRGNPPHKYQGAMRFGWLDLPLLRYAASHVRLNGLVVNHLDQIKARMPVVLNRETGTHWSHQDYCSEKLTPLSSTDEVLEHLSTIAPVKIQGRGPTWEHRVEA